MDVAREVREDALGAHAHELLSLEQDIGVLRESGAPDEVHPFRRFEGAGPLAVPQPPGLADDHGRQPLVEPAEVAELTAVPGGARVLRVRRGHGGEVDAVGAEPRLDVQEALLDASLVLTGPEPARELVAGAQHDVRDQDLAAEVIAVLQDLRGSFILDGEVCVLKENGLPDFESMRARTVRRSGLPVTYFACDLLCQNGRDLRHLPLLERKARLHKFIPSQTPRLQYVGYIEAEGEAMFEQAVAMGMEGIIGKRADSPYTGGRSRDWLKMKRAGYHDGWNRVPSEPA